ncbi:MAG: hypothetical protein N3E38_00060 [Candidatus Aenigmarchaeota archaeon]|nr:hypothetical protein [Candidatus Aenigmarchaeota archaeon]
MGITRRQFLKVLFLGTVATFLGMRVAKSPEWSIGIFTGMDICSLTPHSRNPVLTADDITDLEALFVADPFLFFYEDVYWMFFEVMGKDGKGRIGFAKSSDGFEWKYGGIILDEQFHMSYPHVFEFNKKIYMLPETRKAKRVILFKAKKFPSKWEPLEIIEGEYLDPNFLVYGDDLYILCNSETLYPNEIHVFRAKKIEGPWEKVSIAKPVYRNAGPIIEVGGKLYRPFQGVRLPGDVLPIYGRYVGLAGIDGLNPYKETPLECLLPPNSPWASLRFHHISFLPNKGIAAVDGSNY